MHKLYTYQKDKYVDRYWIIFPNGNKPWTVPNAEEADRICTMMNKQLVMKLIKQVFKTPITEGKVLSQVKTQAPSLAPAPPPPARKAQIWTNPLLLNH